MSDATDKTPTPVWQLRLFSSDPTETHELHVEVAAPTAAAALKIANGNLFGRTWFVDEDAIREKTGPKRYEVEEGYEVQVRPEPEDRNLKIESDRA